MKRHIGIIALLTTMVYSQCGINSSDITVTIQPDWKDLEHNPKYIKKFGGRWILAGTITIVKKAQEKIHLNRLHLQWEGPQESPKIETLNASLYAGECLEDFLPIQENLVCDGVWNSAQQKLLFNFEEQQLLTFKNCFFLVLTVPENKEQLIRNGTFKLVTAILPEPIKECLNNEQICLQYKKNSSPFPKQKVHIAKRQ